MGQPLDIYWALPRVMICYTNWMLNFDGFVYKCYFIFPPLEKNKIKIDFNSVGTLLPGRAVYGILSVTQSGVSRLWRFFCEMMSRLATPLTPIHSPHGLGITIKTNLNKEQKVSYSISIQLLQISYACIQEHNWHIFYCIL